MWQRLGPAGNGAVSEWLRGGLETAWLRVQFPRMGFFVIGECSPEVSDVQVCGRISVTTLFLQEVGPGRPGVGVGMRGGWMNVRQAGGCVAAAGPSRYSARVRVVKG